MFEFFKQNSFIYKGKCGTVTILTNHKMSCESLSSKVYDSSALKLWYLHCTDIVEIM